MVWQISYSRSDTDMRSAKLSGSSERLLADVVRPLWNSRLPLNGTGRQIYLYDKEEYGVFGIVDRGITAFLLLKVSANPSHEREGTKTVPAESNVETSLLGPCNGVQLEGKEHFIPGYRLEALPSKPSKMM